ncbi:autotransporter domain-containing protein [Rhodopseudomonas boonkerdii]|nr:autotransporter domain-containing protein [Rhodopseudomonas boonkerdii]
MKAIGGMRRASTLFLCTTLLSSAAFPTVLSAAEKLQKPDVRAATKSMAQLALSADQKQSLADALQKGELGLIAQVYESTYRTPGLRDAVVQHASRLAPSSLRNVTTAADLGVLTAGQPMMLSPRSEQMLTTRTANVVGSGIGASAYQNVTQAVNPTPNLPNPPSAADQTWHLDMIHAQQAYNRGFTGAGVNVTVSDTGYDTTNAGLGNKLLTNLGRNYVLPAPGAAYDINQLDPLGAKDAHGTHVAGIIAAQKLDPATGVTMHGVAYDSMIIPLRTLLATGTTAAAAPGIPDGTVAGMNYFASLTNSMVLNASYGPGVSKDDPPQKVWTIGNIDAELTAVGNALEKGKIIVAANGNSREHSPEAGRNPSGLALLPFLNPSNQRAQNVYDDQGQLYDLTGINSMSGKIIAVMSVGDNKLAAGYSQLCGVTASWCLAAPGGNTDNNGRGVYSTVPYNTYGALEGTSMAAPVVSGAIAVLIQANPSYNAQDLSRLLFSTAEDLGSPGIDAVYGYGLVRLDRATDGPTTLAANATQTVAANTTEYWSRLLTTQGDFTKAGEGILTISGRTNAGGNVFAQLGTLAVDGTLSMTAGNKLNVAQPATLAGFGTVNGDTVIAGTLSPGKMANIGDLVANGSVAPGTVLQGNSVGSLTFNGNVTLTSTANTRIDIDGTLIVPGGPGTYDKIYVTGAGNVFYAAGTLTPVLRGSVGTVSNYTPAIGTEFAFVQAQNGARTAGTFNTLVQPTAGLPTNGRFDLIYSATAITLAVTPASFSALAAGDSPGSNARGIASILDKDRAASGVMPTAAEKALYDALYNLNTEAEFDKALDQLAGPGQPAIAAASLQAFSGFLGAIGSRQDSLSFGSEAGQNGTAQNFALSYAGRNMMTAEANSAMNAFAGITPAQRVQDGWTVWGQGFGRTSRVGDSGDFSGSKTTSAGFTLGADRWFSNNLIAGGAFGYARTTATSTDIKGSSDTYAGAAYASWTPGSAVFDFRIAAGPSQMSTTRQIILASNGLQGSANGVGVGTSFEAGYRFAITPDVIVKPYVGVNWQGFRRDGYSESQVPIGLVYAAQTYDKLMTTAGAAVSAKLRTTDGTTLVPELKLGWGYDLRDTTLTSQAALLDESFLVTAASPGRSAALVGAKLSGWRTETFRMFGAYNGEYRSNATSHQLSAGARFAW